MFEVILFLILISILSWLVVKSSHKSRTKWLIVIISLLIITRCLLKWETWLDLPSYAYGFDLLSNGTWNDFSRNGWLIDGLKAEPLWIVYNWIVAFVYPNFHLLLFTTALLTFIGYYIFIKEWINDRFLIYCVLLILLGSYSQSFYVLRQHLAIGIVLWSFFYLLKKEYIKMIISYMVAFGFHQTAIFVLPVFLFHIFIKNTKLTFLCLGIYAVLLTIIIQFVPMIVGTYFSGLSSYATLDDDSNAVNSKMMILQMALLIWRLIVMKKKCWDEGINRFLTLLMIIGFINALVGTGTTTYMSRLNMYYSELAFLYVPNTLSFVKSYNLRTLYGVIYILFIGYFKFRNLMEIPNGQNLFVW